MRLKLSEGESVFIDIDKAPFETIEVRLHREMDRLCVYRITASKTTQLKEFA